MTATYLIARLTSYVRKRRSRGDRSKVKECRGRETRKQITLYRQALVDIKKTQHAETSCPMTKNQGLLLFGPQWPHDRIEFATSTPKGDGSTVTARMYQNGLTNIK